MTQQLRALDDTTAAAVLRGGADLDTDILPLVGFVEAVRAVQAADVAPSAELRAIFADGLPPALPAADIRRRITRMRKATLGRVAGLGLGVKLALGTTAAAAAVTGAGAAGALPDAAQAVVSDTIGAVTPFEFPDSASDSAELGERVATDATDGGVVGPTIAEEASQGRAGGAAAAEASAEGRARAEEAKASGQAKAERAKANAGTADVSAEQVPDEAPPADAPRGETPDQADEGLQRGEDARADRPVTPPQPEEAPVGAAAAEHGAPARP